MALEYEQHAFLKELGLVAEGNKGVYNGKWTASGPMHKALNPTTGGVIATVQHGTVEEFDGCVAAGKAAWLKWARAPMPARAEVVRQIGDKLRQKLVALGALVSLEMGKIAAEGVGEVQEFIDICDMCLGLGRQIGGSIIPSERPSHFMMERYNPLGVVGVISAFNFPVAVLGWNASVGMVCGDVIVWKPASSVSLTGIAVTKIMVDVLEANGFDGAIFTMCLGKGSTIGERMLEHKDIPLVSFTGSSAVGYHVSEVVHKRLGQTILELGGNNAIVIEPDADLKMALSAALFGCVGTCGQRCTSTRRLYVHKSLVAEFTERLVNAYKTVRIGSPLDSKTLCGPLHNVEAVKVFTDGIATIKAQGGKVIAGGDVHKAEGAHAGGNFVQPTIVSIAQGAACLLEERFVPIVYIIEYENLQDAIKWNNGVPQGLSSALFTNNQKSIFEWTGPGGSDCGIVNVNIGTSGAEIGGAFGANKEGGGRESGSDAWKQYMSRHTCTINYGSDLPLAQGINFG